jgi:hypothetical protein
MSDGDTKFFGGHSACHRRIHISHNDYEIRSFFDAYFLEGYHYLGGLLSMAP